MRAILFREGLQMPDGKYYFEPGSIKFDPDEKYPLFNLSLTNMTESRQVGTVSEIRRDEKTNELTGELELQDGAEEFYPAWLSIYVQPVEAVGFSVHSATLRELRCELIPNNPPTPHHVSPIDL